MSIDVARSDSFVWRGFWFWCGCGCTGCTGGVGVGVDVSMFWWFDVEEEGEIMTTFPWPWMLMEASMCTVTGLAVDWVMVVGFSSDNGDCE